MEAITEARSKDERDGEVVAAAVSLPAGVVRHALWELYPVEGNVNVRGLLYFVY